MAEDLYGLLGVDKGVSDAELKRAYRKLARQYHPDVNKDPGAADKFKKIQKAYDILSNPQKKAQYDQFGVTDDQAPGGGPGGFHGGAGFEGFSDSFEDIFETFFGGGGGGRRSRGQHSNARHGEDLRYDIDITLEEAAEGVSKSIDVFHMDECGRCHGGGSEPGSKKRTCPQCQGAGQVRTVQRTMLGSFSQVMTCNQCHGQGEIIDKPCSQCHGQGLEKKQKKIKVDIPAGVDRNAKLRVSGEGNKGVGGGRPGDLYVFIHIKEHPHFVREDDDIFLNLEIPFTEAILGTKLDVPILGGNASLKIPPGTQPGTLFKLKGKGLPHLRGFGRGDQLVRVHVDIPKTLSGKEKELIDSFSELRKGQDSSRVLKN